MAESWQLGHRQRAPMDAGEPRVVQLQVARSLGVTQRTLHRHLTEEGQSFSAIVNATRGALAERCLANDRYSLTDVSQLLGFAAPSTFSRWFRGRFGVTPSQWRDSAAHRVPDREEDGLAPRQSDPSEQAQLLGG